MGTQNRATARQILQAGLGTLALIGIWLASPVWQPRLEARNVAQPTPPAAVTAFLAAHGRGDELTADSLASPLYRAE